MSFRILHTFANSNGETYLKDFPIVSLETDVDSFSFVFNPLVLSIEEANQFFESIITRSAASSDMYEVADISFFDLDFLMDNLQIIYMSVLLTNIDSSEGNTRFSFDYKEKRVFGSMGIIEDV